MVRLNVWVWVALVGLLASSSLVPAQDDDFEDEPQTQSLNGLVASVAKDGKSFVVDAEDEDGEPIQVTVKINDKTRYTLDGEESSKAVVLTKGMNVWVNHVDGLAISVAGFGE